MDPIQPFGVDRQVSLRSGALSSPRQRRQIVMDATTGYSNLPVVLAIPVAPVRRPRCLRLASLHSPSNSSHPVVGLIRPGAGYS
jgi:hypothetical protein